MDFDQKKDKTQILQDTRIEQALKISYVRYVNVYQSIYMQPLIKIDTKFFVYLFITIQTVVTTKDLYNEKLLFDQINPFKLPVSGHWRLSL